jgi:hypothetical protein
VGTDVRSRKNRFGPFASTFIDSKLRGCDLVKIKIRDVVAGSEIRTRAIVFQQTTERPVQFEITNDVRAMLAVRCLGVDVGAPGS